MIETGGFSEFDEEKEGLEHKDPGDSEENGISRSWVPTVWASSIPPMGWCCHSFLLSQPDLVKGSISFISQSGGLVHDFLKRCRHEKLRCGKLLSIGNKLMLDENDFLEFLIADPATSSIGIYLESVAEGRRLMKAARSSEKPIIALKGNRSPAGRQIAKFHTAALAGDDRVFDAALKQCGIHRVNNLTEMMQLFKIFTLPLLKGRI